MFKTASAIRGSARTNTYIQLRDSSKQDSSSDMLSLQSPNDLPSTRSLYRKRSYNYEEHNTLRAKRCSVDNFPASEIQEVSDESESNATYQTRRSSQSLKECITDIILSADLDIFGDSSPCSSECGYCTVSQEEEVILPIEVCVQESSMGDYPVTIKYTSDSKEWAVSTVRERATVEVVSSGSSEHDLRCWKLSDDKYVFGFRESGNIYYVYVNTSNNNRLMLTSNGDDPLTNPPSSSDKRVFIREYNSGTKRHNLRPTFSSVELWVDIEDSGTKYASAKNINVSNAPNIDVIPK